MKRIVVLFFVLFSFFGVEKALAWGAKGHDIIAYIAEQNLTKRAKKNITEILDGKSIVSYASWMDQLQNSPDWDDNYDVTKTWHYANVDEGYTYETMPRDPNGDVLEASNMIIETLLSGEATDSVETLYLKLLVHMIGDLHCPMHAGRRSDRGGNMVKIKWFGENTNLHSLWDTALLESARNWSYTEWQKQLDIRNPKEKKQIQYGTPTDWFVETVDIAADIYAGTKAGGDYSYQYIYDFSPIVEQQLLNAGYRLAAVLNKIYG